MAAPIPSFFKIRCWLVIIAFLLFFMFLGAVKRGFAASCSYSGGSCPPGSIQTFDCWDDLQGSFNSSDHTSYNDVESDKVYTGMWVNDCMQIPDGTRGAHYGVYSGESSDISTYNFYFLCQDVPEGVCSSGDCTKDASYYLSTCGVGKYWYNAETCTGCCTTEENHDCDAQSDADDADDDNDGIPDDDDPCLTNPDPDCKPPDADGDGVPDEEEIPPYDSTWLPYGIEESLFGERWTAFVDYLKQTSFFSIPSQVFGGFDSGSGDSSLIIEGGETFGGSHSVEFSTWIPGLAALRGVLYACFCIIAVRIVTLKH